MRRGGTESVVGEVGDAVVAAVDGDPRDRPVGQRVLVAAAVAVLVQARPRRVRVGLGVGAHVDEAVLGAGVDGGAAADSDRGQGAVARAVRRGSGASAGQVRADGVPVNVARRGRLRVVCAVDAGRCR